MVEGLGRLPYECKGEENWKLRKIKLAREVLDGLSKFEAKESYINGVLHLEICDTHVQVSLCPRYFRYLLFFEM